MDNCFLMIFTAMSGVGAVVGVVAAICIFYRQKKIALFERRMKILNDFEQFVFVVLRDWNWNGSTTLVSKYSEQEVALLFNEEYSELQKDILKVLCLNTAIMQNSNKDRHNLFIGTDCVCSS